MKKNIYRLLMFMAVPAVLSGCLGDNYEQPNASLYGKVIDQETGELILQDIGSEGSEIEIVEQGYSSTSSRYLNFKTNGTYCEKNMFDGVYLVQANRTNFVPLAECTVKVKGETEFNITSLPYCRVKIVKIDFLEEKQRVEATFTVTCTTKDPLKEIGLFCDANSNVSYSINNSGDKSCKVDVNQVLYTPQTYTIKMPLTTLEDNNDYYFRVGAHTSVDEARWNYSEAVRFHIVKKEAPMKERGIKWDIFDTIDKWYVHKSIDGYSWDDKDFKFGNGSISVTSRAHDGGPGYTQFITPGDDGVGLTPRIDLSEIPFEGTHMLLTMFCSDAAHFTKTADGQIEIGSAGIYDQEEICWTFAQFDLRDGWQTLDLSLPEGNAMGDLRRKRVNWFRFYHLQETGPTTVKFNDIHFYYKTLVDDCDDESTWTSPQGISLDETDYKQGEGCVRTTNKQDIFSISKVFRKPFYAPARMEDGYLQFWLFVSDPDRFNTPGGQIEITSAGKYDEQELGWEIPTLTQGWNKITLKLSEAVTRGGEIDLKHVNFFRIWKTMTGAAADEVVGKIDGIRFFQGGYAPADEEAD